MRKIRVLVVDDSVVIRRLLTDVLGQDPEIELAGTAPNGKIALAKLPQLAPDLVTLDIEMPELDGLGTLPELRKLYPRLPVIMFSTLTERGAVSTLDALALGASDYVTKPANVGSVAAAIQSVREQLIPKIKALCSGAASVKPVRTLPPVSTVGFMKTINRLAQRTDVVVVGSSTGGPQALQAVLGELPESFPVPIVVVQHMPPLFTRHLADRLNQQCALEVCEAAHGDVVAAGTVLIAPGNYHVELRRGARDVTIALTQTPPENSCRPAVDVLFRSAAQLFGPHCSAVVLTGMGQDGRRGAEQIVRAGGQVTAQDEATSVVWGMPRSVAEAGLARNVLPLGAIAKDLLKNVAVGRRPTVTL